MSTTRLICTSLVIAATVYDVIALQIGGVDASISRWFSSFSSYPMPVFGCGYLCGHFFGWITPGKLAGSN